MEAELEITAVKRKDYLNAFRQTHATSSSRAIFIKEYGMDTTVTFYKLIRQRVIVPVSGNKYYLDEEREAVVNERHKKSVLILTIILVFATIMLLMIALIQFAQ